MRCDVDSKDLKQLMEYISRSNFIEIEIEQEGLKLKLVKEGTRLEAPAAGNSFPVGAYPVSVTPPARPQPAAPADTPPPEAPKSPHAAPAREEGICQVTAPMVGTFYRATNPNAPPYVEVGTVVKKGQVLCILEAMKLMNEIESEVAGEILEIPVANGQPVEYGEVIFRIRLTS
jgi:acetyl-CoA carboxylase biotin carboxyl carrier protein